MVLFENEKRLCCLKIGKVVLFEDEKGGAVFENKKRRLYLEMGNVVVFGNKKR